MSNICHSDYKLLLEIIPYIKEIIPYIKYSLGLRQPSEFETFTMSNGIKFIHRKNTYDLSIIKEVWEQRVYNPQGFNINVGDIVVDVGAHIGSFTLLAAKSSEKTKVLAFEPNPTSFTILKKEHRGQWSG